MRKNNHITALAGGCGVDSGDRRLVDHHPECELEVPSSDQAIHHDQLLVLMERARCQLWLKELWS